MRIAQQTLQRFLTTSLQKTLLMIVVITAVTAVVALGQTQEFKMTAGDGAEGDRFGYAVLDGNRALVGAPWDDDKGDQSGALYVFERQASGSWVETFKIVPDDGAAEDRFGVHNALAGDLAFVGLPDAARLNGGMVYVFERQASGAWVEIQRLTASNGIDGDRFGAAIDVHDGRLLISAESREESRGVVYVFERDAAGTWREAAQLVATNRRDGERFGRSVSLWDDVAIVTSFRTDDLTGTVYAFERQAGGNWVETAVFRPANTAFYDGFGQTSALWENQLIVGSNGPNPSNSAYIFERQANGTWREMAAFYGYFFFGEAVSIDDGRAVIGAYLDEQPEYKGAAYIIDRQEGGSWVQVARVLAGDGESDDSFGDMVAIDGDLMLVGAPGDDDRGAGSGSVYVYNLSDFTLTAAGFSLIDASTNSPIPDYDPIPEAAVLNLKELPRYLNVRANTSADVESVRFAYTDNRGREQQHVENVAPYALYGDSNGNYDESSLPLGA